MILSGTEQVQRDRVDCGVPCATTATSSRCHPRFTPSRWLILGGVFLALLLSQATSADAVTINSQTAPNVTDKYNKNAGSLHQSLLNAQDTDKITFHIRDSDPGYNDRAWTIGLTSGQLAIDKNITLNGPPVSLLMLRRDRHATSYSIGQGDSARPVAIEDLTISDGLALPMRLVLLTGGATGVLFLSLVLFYRHLQRPTGRRIRFGILWNAYKPICAKCGGLLHVLNDYSFHCPVCRVELGALGMNGRTISPREALVKIRLKEYW